MRPDGIDRARFTGGAMQALTAFACLIIIIIVAIIIGNIVFHGTSSFFML